MKRFDLEPRTFLYGKKCIVLVMNMPKNLASIEVGRQLIWSGGSVGANYIEANEGLGEKDFIMHIKICRN